MTKRRLGGCVGECLQRRIRHEPVWLIIQPTTLRSV